MSRRLLRSDKVRAAVEAIKSRAAEAAEVSVECVLREFAVLALAPLEAALPIPHVLSAKLKALELLGKHLGLFSQHEEAGGERRSRRGASVPSRAWRLTSDLRRLQGDVSHGRRGDSTGYAWGRYPIRRRRSR